jgi:hypothetical protein
MVVPAAASLESRPKRMVVVGREHTAGRRQAQQQTCSQDGISSSRTARVIDLMAVRRGILR